MINWKKLDKKLYNVLCFLIIIVLVTIVLRGYYLGYKLNKQHEKTTCKVTKINGFRLRQALTFEYEYTVNNIKYIEEEGMRDGIYLDSIYEVIYLKDNPGFSDVKVHEKKIH